jgi:hypothetical protein
MRSALVATFELVPSSSHLNSTAALSLNSTRPISLYGATKPWPLPYPDDHPPNTSQTLNAFLAHSSVGQVLHVHVDDWRGVDYMEYRKSGALPPQTTFLATRTWITMAGEYSIYDLEGFKSASSALKTFKASYLRSCPLRPISTAANLSDRPIAPIPHIFGTTVTERLRETDISRTSWKSTRIGKSGITGRFLRQG